MKDLYERSRAKKTTDAKKTPEKENFLLTRTSASDDDYGVIIDPWPEVTLSDEVEKEIAKLSGQRTAMDWTASASCERISAV